MDGSIGYLIAALVLLVLMSAYFSATETAFSSLNKIRLKNMMQSGDRKAEATYNLHANYDKLISTILIGNNIVNILAASLGTVLFTKLCGEDLGVSVSATVITVVVLIFGEITPKSIAKDMPESFAIFSTPMIKFLIAIFTPLTFIFGAWKNMVLKLFKNRAAVAITEDELITYVDEAEFEGGINSEESELIRSAIEFNDIEVDAILTPRVDIVAIDENESMDSIAQLFRLNGFSRFPVYRGSVDTIVGVLHEKDFNALRYKKAENISSVIGNVVCTTANMKIPALLKKLQHEKTHMAVVLDEFGGTLGIVTMEDIIEELVGEIWDEHDEVVELYQQIDENTFLVSGSANLEDAFEAVGISELEREYEALTVNGWVLEEVGHIPKENEQFTYGRAKVTITQIDFRRVVQIQIDIMPCEEE